ncbi:MAG: pseudaminic acid cytidylyltransferase [Lachnospiraceae bacterium]|nr:pseudaminic acid cytidylyltransferase [Lachnospiraceae bacterium]
MKTLAIITARGGSKRIPRKNIKDFNGKPIMAYSIEAAVGSGVFDKVMVSTEDEEIAEIGRRYGAEVPFYRSEQTAGDFATTTDVLNEVIAEYEKRGEKFDIIACIYPTAPFITSERLRNAVEMLKNSDADSLIPVVRFSFPPQRAMEIQDGLLVFRQPEYMNSRSQDLTPHYHDVGQFYVFRTDGFKKNQRIMAGKILPIELPETEVQDIDNPVDWQLAELKYKLVHGE